MLRDAMSGCPLLCMRVWRALPQSWVPVTSAGSPGKMYTQQHPLILTRLQQFQCVLLCFIKSILRNQRTVLGFLHERAKRARTHDLLEWSE